MLKSLVFFMLLFCLVSKAQAIEEHFFIIGSYEASTGIAPAESHVFGVWLKIENERVIDEVVINWTPKDGSVNLATSIVDGVNRPVRESIEYARKTKKDLHYEVFRTDATFFHDAREHVKKLKKYKTLDRRTRPEAVNCIHAISDVSGRLETGMSYGKAAATKITSFFSEKKRIWFSPNGELILSAYLRSLNLK